MVVVMLVKVMVMVMMICFPTHGVSGKQGDVVNVCRASRVLATLRPTRSSARNLNNVRSARKFSAMITF